MGNKVAEASLYALFIIYGDSHKVLNARESCQALLVADCDYRRLLCLGGWKNSLRRELWSWQLEKALVGRWWKFQVGKTGGINAVWSGNEQELFNQSKFFLYYCYRNDSWGALWSLCKCSLLDAGTWTRVTEMRLLINWHWTKSARSIWAFSESLKWMRSRWQRFFVLLIQGIFYSSWGEQGLGKTRNTVLFSPQWCLFKSGTTLLQDNYIPEMCCKLESVCVCRHLLNKVFHPLLVLALTKWQVVEMLAVVQVLERWVTEKGIYSLLWSVFAEQHFVCSVKQRTFRVNCHPKMLR